MVTEWVILNQIQDILGNSIMDAVMPKITLLGEYGFIWILIGVVLIFTKKYRKVGLLLLFSLLLGLIVGNGIIKNVVQRPRPCWINTDFKILISNPKDYSFPSGHTQSAAIAATILTLYKRKWGIVAIPLAFVIAFSRLYLYVHFPSDIIGGVAIGIAIGCFTYIMGDKIFDIRQRYYTIEK